MGIFSRSWNITKLSFNVIKQDKELILFPLVGGILSILFMISMLFPTIISGIISHSTGIYLGIFEYLLIFITYLGLSFIAVFFNVCVVYTAKKRFAGGNATFKESIKFALSRIHLIFLWSLLSATVGLILSILDRMAQKSGQAGRIILSITRSLLGMVWSIVTIFVVPAMVYENLKPIEAIKKSVSVLKKTWGESIIRSVGLGLIEFLFVILGILIAVPLIILSINLGKIMIIISILIIISYFIGLILIFSVAASIFNTALYEYADRGKVPAGYDSETLRNSFKSKKISNGII